MIQKDGSKEEAGEIFKSLVPEGWEEEAAGSPTPLQDCVMNRSWSKSSSRSMGRSRS